MYIFYYNDNNISTIFAFNIVRKSEHECCFDANEALHSIGKVLKYAFEFCV